MPPNQNEFHFKRSANILNYISKFTATEKAIFATLFIVVTVTALIMAFRVNAAFMTEIPGYGGTINEGLIGLPRTINPVLAITDTDKDIAAVVYSGLMKYGKDGPILDLAKAYTVSTDGLIYTFTLRGDAEFQDGSPVTAEDVAFTIEKIMNASLKSPRRPDWVNVAVKVLSPTKIQFTLKQAYSPFIDNLTIGILPKHIWSDFNDDQFNLSDKNIFAVGSGPYKISGVDRDGSGIPSTIHLKTWHDYYAKEPYVKNLSFSFYADEEHAVEALEAGYIDSLPSVDPVHAKELSSDHSVLTSPLPRVFGVFFNQNQATVLADKNVRLALDMAVNRESIVEAALNSFGSPLYGPLPLGVIPESANKQSDPGLIAVQLKTTATASSTYLANVAKAQTILERAGWKRNASTDIYEKSISKTAVQSLQFNIYTADTPELKKAAEIVRDNWNFLGANVTVKVFETSDLYQNVIRTRKYDALLFGEFIGKDRDFYAFWHSSQRNSPGLNVASYANPRVDRLLEEIRETGNETARLAKYKSFADLIKTDVPAVFLYTPDFIYVVPKNLRDVGLEAVTVPSDRFIGVTNWYSTTERVWKIIANL